MCLALVLLAAACDALVGDYTGDRKADQVYFDTTNGNWYETGDAAPLYTSSTTDLRVAGDYNGDLKWEPAVLRGTTWTSSALSAPIDYDPAGLPAGPPGNPAGTASAPLTLLPVPGDYDGTGRTVPAYYDQVDGTWWIMGHDAPVQFGVPPVAGGNLGYDVPVPADYDGDGKTDIAVYRPTDGSFHYLSSKTGLEVEVTPTVPASDPAVIPVPANYDGGNHAEAAVTEPSGENWYVAGHASSIATFDTAGISDPYLPAMADYDGTGKAQPALLDDANDQLWLAGRSRPPIANVISYRYEPTVLPEAVIVNIVRLVLYAECRAGTGSFPPGTC